MPSSVMSLLACPVCGGSLSRVGQSLVCEKRHTFDVSRSGYVNLLPPGKEKNAHTGDEKAMIRARADFLSCGHYSRISTTLAELTAEERGVRRFCDMGSGEGRHTLTFAARLAEITGAKVAGIGADASKYGAEAASKLSRSLGFMPEEGIGGDFCGNTEVSFVTANIFALPVRSESLDGCISMFAPVPWDECRRTLGKGGLLAVVSSGRDHLIEMRRLIYDDVHETDFAPVAAEEFAKASSSSISYTAHLSTEKEIHDLFTMTPFYYRTNEEGRTRLFARRSLDVTVNVNYTFFVKL